MLSLKDLLVGEVQKGLSKAGITGAVDFTGQELTITLRKADLEDIIKKSFPQPYANFVTVEANDIKIKVKVM